MTLYPRRGAGLQKLFDGSRLNQEFSAEVATPMVELKNLKQAYVFEPCKLKNDRFVFPISWYTENDSLFGESYIVHSSGNFAYIPTWGGEVCLVHDPQVCRIEQQ